jgi:hypothetical protein
VDTCAAAVAAQWDTPQLNHSSLVCLTVRVWSCVSPLAAQGRGAQRVARSQQSEQHAMHHATGAVGDGAAAAAGSGN